MTMIVIYSKESCTYCRKSKEFLSNKGIGYTTIEMDKMDPQEYSTKRDEMVEKTGQKTIPWIFVGDKFIGGYSELVNSYSTYQLHKLLDIDDSDDNF